MIPQLFLISLVCFVIIDLPPGSYLNTYIMQLQQSGTGVALEQLEQLEKRYGLDKPIYYRYWVWIKGIVTRGDFGESFKFQRPVAELIWERLAWTIFISVLAFLVSWALGIPMGIYSAVHRYTIGDHLFTVFGFLGMSIPNFVLALALMFMMGSVFGAKSVGGLFSPEYVAAPWSWAKFSDFLEHIWIPVVVIGTASWAGVIRKMRGTLLEILNQPYIQTARSKGLAEGAVIHKHAVRNAFHPLIMSLGMTLPTLLEGELATSIVVGLPTVGLLFYQAIMAQDTYLVGSFLLLLSFLLVVGNLLADIALAGLDPRVRYE